MADETLHAQLLAAVDAFDTELETPGGLLDAASDISAALRAVVKLHAPVYRYEGADSPSCRGCDKPRMARRPSWPCSTIRTIAHELGITEEGTNG